MIVKRGDLFPDVEAIVKDENGNVVNTTGATILFTMRAARNTSYRPVQAAAGVVVNGPLGKIGYNWISGDTEIAAGTYEGEFKVSGLVGGPYRVPTDGYVTIVVEERLSTSA